MKLKRALLITVLLFVFTALFLVVSPYPAQNLIVEIITDKPEAIWVLGGSKVHKIRCRKAAEFFDAETTKKIFVVDDGNKSGWNQLEQRNIPFGELSKRELVNYGIPEDRIEIVKPTGDGTNYEAEFFAEMSKNQPFNKILLVTSDYHTRRALWSFEHFVKKNNLQTKIGVVATNDFRQKNLTEQSWFSLRNIRITGIEYAKLVYYYLFV